MSKKKGVNVPPGKAGKYRAWEWQTPEEVSANLADRYHGEEDWGLEDFGDDMPMVDGEEFNWEEEGFDSFMAGLEKLRAQTAMQKEFGFLPGRLAPNQPSLLAEKPIAKATHCEHLRQPFTFKVGKNEYTLHGSAYSNRKSKAQAEPADWRVYLEHRWMQECGPVWVNHVPGAGSLLGGARLTPSNTIPTIFLDWPDMGVLDIKDLKPVVQYISHITRIRSVEIGCMGGHGRTGTLMALIMVELGCKPGKAIKAVRRDYCEKAIETKEQEALIKTYAKEVQA